MARFIPSILVVQALTAASPFATASTSTNQASYKADRSAVHPVSRSVGNLAIGMVPPLGDGNVLTAGTSTSTLPRSLPAGTTDVINVKDYGAKGDGTTDDTVAIQTAIAAVQTGEARALLLPHGTYKTTATLDFSSWNDYNRQYTVDLGGSSIVATGLVRVPALSFVAREFLTIRNGYIQASGGTRPIGIKLNGLAKHARGTDSSLVSGLVIDGFFENLQLGSAPDRRVAFTRFENILTVNGAFGMTLRGLVDRCNFDSINTSAHGLSVAISGAGNNGAGLVRVTTRTTHSYETGDKLIVQGVKGTLEANGYWTITVIDSTHFDLQGTNFVAAYKSGGKSVLGAGAWLVGPVGANKWSGFTSYGNYPLYLVDGAIGEQTAIATHVESSSGTSHMFSIWRGATGNGIGYRSPWIFLGGDIGKAHFGPGAASGDYQTMFIGSGLVDAITVSFSEYHLTFLNCTSTPNASITVSGAGSRIYLTTSGTWMGSVTLSGAGGQLITDRTVFGGQLTVSGGAWGRSSTLVGLAGTAALVGGTVTVSTGVVQATTKILVSRRAAGGTIGDLMVASFVAGTSFTVTSNSGADTSTVDWILIN